MSHYKIGSVCAVYGCNNYKQQKDSKSFFRMPKDKYILEKWIAACKRKDLNDLMKTQQPEYFYNNYVVCSDHFEIQCFRNKNLFSQGLFPGSMPMLKLYKMTNTLKRKSQKQVCQEPSAKKSKSQICVPNEIVEIPEEMCETSSDTHSDEVIDLT